MQSPYINVLQSIAADIDALPLSDWFMDAGINPDQEWWVRPTMAFWEIYLYDPCFAAELDELGFRLGKLDIDFDNLKEPFYGDIYILLFQPKGVADDRQLENLLENNEA